MTAAVLVWPENLSMCVSVFVCFHIEGRGWDGEAPEGSQRAPTSSGQGDKPARPY